MFCNCDNTCTAAQVGTYCPDAGHVATCASDPNGCHLSSGTTACLGTRTCQGTPGSASCQCQPIGTQSPVPDLLLHCGEIAEIGLLSRT